MGGYHSLPAASIDGGSIRRDHQCSIGSEGRGQWRRVQHRERSGGSLAEAESHSGKRGWLGLALGVGAAVGLGITKAKTGSMSSEPGPGQITAFDRTMTDAFVGLVGI